MTRIFCGWPNEHRRAETVRNCLIERKVYPVIAEKFLRGKIGVWAALLLVASARISLGALSSPQVDSYNVRIGTETFDALYKFTTNTVLVETAQAITNMGSDAIKFYLGANASGQEGVTLTSNITN